MEEYSREWKIKKGSWVQAHKNSQGDKIYKIHWLDNDTEYSTGLYFTKAEAEQDMRKLFGK